MFEKLSGRANELLSPVSGIHIESNRELVVENCRRIEECDEVFMQFISGHLRCGAAGSAPMTTARAGSSSAGG